MPTWLGIDIGSVSVKAAVVRATYRKLAIGRIASAEISVASADGVGPGRTHGEAVAAAVREAVGKVLESEPAIDAVATSIDGSRAAIRRLQLPATAQKQLADVLAFELESVVAFDMAGAVFDWRQLERAPGDDEGQLSIVAAVARIEDVRERIELVRNAMSMEPERVAVGALALGALVPHIAGLTETPVVAIIDLGARASEVLVIERGEPVFARTLSTGTEGLPATASRLARDLRVSLSAHRAAGGAAPSLVYLCGGGAFVSGAEGFLSGELEIPVQLLPGPAFDTSAVADPARELARYSKAIALALTLAGRGASMDLRRGPLSFERGFSWVREKIPLLAGLAAVILVSFVFSSWARFYAVHHERDVLASALGTVTKEVLGTEATTADDAQDLLKKEVALSDDDPMPHADAFDVMVGLSEAIPESLTHDIEELDVQKGHVQVRGVVHTIPEAQSIAQALSERPCLTDVKIKSTMQQVGSDRQKYALELDMKCAEDVKAPAKKKSESAAQSASSATGEK